MQMSCPRCVTAQLQELERDGVTVDRCERCRGLWLDRGELEKLQSGGARFASREEPRDERSRRDDDRPRRDDDDDDDDDNGRRRDGGRRSWWDIFD